MSRSVRALESLWGRSFLLTISLIATIVACGPGKRAMKIPEPRNVVISNVTIIDGTGAPPYGPATVSVDDGRIVDIALIDHAAEDGGEATAIPRPEDSDALRIDATGQYLTPGFVNMHVHLAHRNVELPVEYQYKLLLAHGVTTVREAGGSGHTIEWLAEQKAAAEAGTIVAPRIYPYVFARPGGSVAKMERRFAELSNAGIDGVKAQIGSDGIGTVAQFVSAAHRCGLRVMIHNESFHDAVELATAGVDTCEHWYGLPEALSGGSLRMRYYEYRESGNEQEFFRIAGTLWRASKDAGFETWGPVADALVEADLTLVPTLSVYEACADVAAARNREWHDDYTHPELLSFFEPNRGNHGSFWYSWTTRDEVMWRENLHVWQEFLRLYHERGGRIATGSDAGFLYSTHGFAYVRELELLYRAGITGPALIRAATLAGAEALGAADLIGSVEVGKAADLVLHSADPLDDLKPLYATGAVRLTDSGTVERFRGIRLVMKDGRIYDPEELLADVRSIVAAAN